MPLVKPEFALFQVQVEGCWVDAMEFHKSPLRKGPKRFDSVDMSLSVGEFISSMVDTIMLFVPEVN